MKVTLEMDEIYNLAEECKKYRQEEEELRLNAHNLLILMECKYELHSIKMKRVDINNYYNNLDKSQFPNIGWIFEGMYMSLVSQSKRSLALKKKLKDKGVVVEDYEFERQMEYGQCPMTAYELVQEAGDLLNKEKEMANNEKEN